MLGSQLALSLGEVCQLLPIVEARLFVLPALAQFGQIFSGQTLILLVLSFFQGAIGIGFCLIFGVDRSSLADQGLAEFNLLPGQIAQYFLLAGDLLLQVEALGKLLAPDTEALA